MSYIVFVQPTILSAAGMPFGSVLLATCLSSAFGCLLMGFIAGYPIALAPGMGANFLFAFTICGVMGFSWQAGLAIVFIAGALFVILSTVGLRERVMAVLPDCLKHAIGPAIGLFITFVGLQWSGIVVLHPGTIVTLGGFHGGPPLLASFGVLLIAGLMARGFRGAILAGILATSGLGLATGVLSMPAEPIEWGVETVLQFNFNELAGNWQMALTAILLFFFLDLFDTVGTLVGVSRLGGFLDEKGDLPRASRAFFCDAAATCAGACLGTSTVTSYIESSTGVAAGARTGLAAVVTGICFLGAPVLAPFIRVAGADVGAAYYQSLGIEHAFVSMYPAVAPALIVVGMLMMEPLRHVEWNDVTEGLPAFITVVMMAFGFGITEGIALGCISFTIVKVLAGRPRDVHPIMYGLAVALLARYAFLV